MATLTDRFYMTCILMYMVFMLISTLVAMNIAKKRKAANGEEE